MADAERPGEVIARMFREHAELLKQQADRYADMATVLSDLPLTTAEPMKKKRGRPPKEKKPRDPSRPKKPMSSFLLWCHDRRLARAQAGQEKESPGDLGSIWKSMTPEQKQPYVDRSNALRESWQTDIKEYDESHGEVNPHAHHPHAHPHGPGPDELGLAGAAAVVHAAGMGGGLPTDSESSSSEEEEDHVGIPVAAKSKKERKKHKKHKKKHRSV